MGAVLAALPKLASIVGVAVRVVEELKGEKKGAEKQTAAVGMVSLLGGLLEDFDIRLLQDPAVLTAVKGMIDAQVALMNAIEQATG